MKKVFGLICAATMLVACGSASADVRCWIEPDGFKECVYDKNYNAYGSIKNHTENVDVSKYPGEDKRWEEIFGYANMVKIRSAAIRSGKTVDDYIADKLSNGGN